jgi:uncharacterized membrane protein YkvA (DUF1232 family)
MPQSKLFSYRGWGIDGNIAAIFEPLCVLSTPEELIQLQTAVNSHVETVRSALRYNEFLDLAVVEQSAEVLDLLLMEYQSFSPEHQRLISGAAYYFVNKADAEPDTESLFGFEDDIQVINYVLDTVDCRELKIQV